jgi:SAM-dependent methyltransferase
MIFNRVLRAVRDDRNKSVAAYERHLRNKLRSYPNDRDLAFAEAIGSVSVESFNRQGDGHVAVLRHHGLKDGMSIYDLGCGCGRTAQALQRSGWKGHYSGADVVVGFVSELKRKCPGFEARVHRQPTIMANEASLDMLFHWSVFTHISIEECFLYLEDSFRALKPSGKLVFSFLELSDPEHYTVFDSRLARLRRGRSLRLLDTFIHRDWIALWADKTGFEGPHFTDGQDNSQHPEMWQTIAAMVKPA